MAKRKGYSGGFGGGMPGGNMQGLMQQAQRMQAEMARVQAELEEQEITASAGGGMINVTVTGKKQLTSVKIDPQAVDPDDVEMLEDMVMAAVNEALRKVDEISSAEMGKLTGGLNLPGMF